MTPEQRRKHIQDRAAKIVASLMDEGIPMAMAALAALLACRALLDMMMERASYPDGPGGFPELRRVINRHITTGLKVGDWHDASKN